tara:strand:- start:3099 stop:3776 length:678 start_codon:yes stop_codon:yes gene_type:complete
MNCSIEFVHDAFQSDPTPSGVHLIIPYATFILSSFILLFGSYALPSIGVANSLVVYAIGVDVAMTLWTGRECTSITFTIIGLSFFALICSLFIMRYFRRGFFTALALAISSYNALRPVPLPAAGSLVIMDLPLATGWSFVLASSLLGFWIRGNVARAGRLVCAAHGANGVCSVFPILCRLAFSIQTQVWHTTILYAILFALSFFVQYVPKTSPVVRLGLDYGLYI